MSETLDNTTQTSNSTYREPTLHQHLAEEIHEIIERVAGTVSPVYPLKDYVAVNPYAGIAERPFLDARAFLRVFSDCETLMPISHYAEQYRLGRFGLADIESAIEELQADGLTPLPSIFVREHLESTDTMAPANRRDRVRTVAELANYKSDVDWPSVILNEISKICSAHYDDGQALWQSPGRHLPLYQAWRLAACHDRNVEILGLSGFRGFVEKLPHSSEAAVVTCLHLLGVPTSMWETVLLCQAHTMLGWSAWTRYQTDEANSKGMLRNDFADLLAIRLAYEVAISHRCSLTIDWASYAERSGPASISCRFSESAMLRYTLLRASEIGYRKSLVASLALSGQTEERQELPKRKLAQMVFCIDVRSERIRRQLESLSDNVETHGFAGFFGMPIEFMPLSPNSAADDQGIAQVPVLLKPSFQVREALCGCEHDELAAAAKRSELHLWRKMWKVLQSSATSCFSFVESIGLTYAWSLLARGLGWQREQRMSVLGGGERENLAPTLRGLHQQGMTTSRQVDLAESMLTNLGLTHGFARLVVLCGHTSQTDNNPLRAGLDCGACGGHSGEPNARFAALLLNQTSIRGSLRERGIEIPEDTHFLAAIHNTTTDSIEYFDSDDVPHTHAASLQELQTYTSTASELTAQERFPCLNNKSIVNAMRRAQDWSEVRPEWGLAGNAAFIAAPRAMTRGSNLAGRAFLHSYDWQQDPDGSVLETIMTAPLIVANWINLQYYGSTVDPLHFGSGDKTIHNVVGQFGVLSGNSGDLMTGLPTQSLHDGNQYQHLPLRLQAVIAAPRASIERVIAKHEVISNLLANSWMHLIAIEDGTPYRYAADGSWQELSPDMAFAKAST